MPRSIRGRLILVFLIALTPVLCVQICNGVDDLFRARTLYLSREKAEAAAIASSISLEMANLVSRHEAYALELTGTGTMALGVEPARKQPNDTAGIETSTILQPDSLQTNAPARAGVGRTTVSDPELMNGSLAGFTLTTPVRLRDGRAGNLITHIDGDWLIERMSSARARGWCLYAANSRQSVWVRDRRVVAVDSKSPVRFADSSGTFVCPGCPIADEECIGAVARVPGTNWDLTVLDTTRNALEPARRQRNWVLGTLLAAIAGLSIVFAMGNRLSSPILRLAHLASAISVGDYRKRINLRTGNELQALGESFNTLGESLTNREEALRKQAEMLAGMAEAARVVASSLSIRECGRAVAKVLCSHMGATDAAVFRKDRVDGGLKVIGRSGKYQRAIWKRLASHSADSGGYLLIQEQRAEPTADGSRPNAFLVGVPLSTGTSSLGAIVLRFEGDLEKDDLRLGSVKSDALIAFGIHAAAAIRNAEAYSQTERYSEVLEDWVEHLSSVMQVTNAISPSLNLEETLSALSHATAAVLNVDECEIFLPDREGNLVIRSCCSLSPELASQIRLRPGQGQTGRAFAEKHYVTCFDQFEADDPITREYSRLSGLRGLLSTPLMVEDRAIGVITVLSRGPREFTAQEIRLLTSIGLHAAVIVRNASLYTREASIAETLQKGLIPDVPEECRGLGFAARYIPALDEARVGGDFYDVTELPNGMVGVVMADVSGKGLTAAIHLATCKYMLKSLMFAHPGDPGLVLSKLNDAFNYYFDLSFFVTVLYAVIDPKTGAVYYANAGHPPALLVSRGGRMQTCLTASGVPIGSGRQCLYETRRVDAATSDLLLLYTDGVTDVVSDGALLEVEGLQRVVFEAGQCSATELIEITCDRLCPDNSSSHRDDIALLAVSFEGIAGVAGAAPGGADESEYRLTARTA